MHNEGHAKHVKKGTGVTSFTVDTILLILEYVLLAAC